MRCGASGARSNAGRASVLPPKTASIPHVHVPRLGHDQAAATEDRPNGQARAGRIQPDAAQVQVAAAEPEQDAAAAERGRVALEFDRRQDRGEGDLVIRVGADRREPPLGHGRADDARTRTRG